MKRKKAVFNWSGGKDSALALHKVLQGGEYDVISLLTTINEDTQTSSIHAVPIKYIQAQADRIGIPLYTVQLSKDTPTYEQGMLEAVEHFKAKGVNHFIFGDIFLEDVRQYRENRLTPAGISLVEPLWGLGSKEVMRQFLASGLKTKIVVTQANKLDGSFIGKTIDETLIKSLPKDVDICGEYGEFHTFSYDGPLFKKPIKLDILSAKLISYEFRMEDGILKKFDYWQAEFKPD